MAAEARDKHFPSVLITDLDNTLWDWFAAWHDSFAPMLDRLSVLSGIPTNVLEPEIRAIHQLRGTSEYSNLLNELPSLISQGGELTPLERYDEAVHVLNSRRLEATQLYPGVKDTLRTLKARGVTIAAYTESVAYWTEWRVKHTGLDGLIGSLYSAPDHDLPRGTTIESLRRRPPEEYGLNSTIHKHIPRHELKPNPAVLKYIISDIGAEPADTIYVGDSLMKDVAMARSAGVLDAYAKYGTVQSRPEYELLRRVSHWPEETVERERSYMHTPQVEPTVILDVGFADILQVFGLVSDNQ
ncbi:phosphoglycolate phosphatase [Mycobacteroides abscessus subsp. abscessus]|uniref:Phosphoglycolate phosphatase n=2 Tax=Mycobacteriaceae TaxID=1762 RepID=A0AB33T3H2_9MYCO|nr:MULTISPECIES: HAD family hydrolase [Mycobacteriaceae]MDO3017397.1 HAD hydrolase-like protein [Mycobacteroides abscessus subsp. abscessus]MDO3083401.1 HAD hydrolase-like protein [Mycobacteroides abscessus subsp. abscessus]ORA75848.1 haloacid dehalogenase [Mycolicibacter kumamotonensis]PVB18033.1 HAD family hydrolase [Mycobacteroides abscessus]RIR96897.1 HAD family hydrolase [Mycobacteroides abscessus]